jgi:hypothetical protein
MIGAISSEMAAMMTRQIGGSMTQAISGSRISGRPQMFENQTDIGAIARRLTGVMMKTQMEEIAGDRN